MSEAVRLKTADQMSPYEALLRSFGYNERFTPEDLAEVRAAWNGPFNRPLRTATVGPCCR